MRLPDMKAKMPSLLVALSAVATGIAAGEFFDNQRIITWAGIIGLFITTYLAQQKTQNLSDELHNGTFEGLVKRQVKTAVIEMAKDPDTPAVEIQNDIPYPREEGRNG